MISLRMTLIATCVLFAFETCGQSPVPRMAAETEIQTRRLLELLRSPRFSDRREASRQLQQMGAGAHGVLRQIIESGDSESATRALDLLKQATRSRDPEIASSARATLEEIAASDSPRARSADQALNPSSHPRLPDLFGGPALPGPALPGQALPLVPQLPPPGFAPQGRTNLRVTIRSINGVREIEVIQNDKRYWFRDAGAGLETERPDGKGGVTKQTDKDAEEVRQKDPEAYGAYQRSGGGKGGMIQIRPRGGIFGNGLQPAIPQPNFPQRPLRQLPRQQGPRIERLPEAAPPPAPNRIPKPVPKRIEV